MEIGFDPFAAMANLLLPLQIIVIDLTLSGDNALVIALATRGLPANEARVTIVLGTLGAIVLRIGMAGIALTLMQIPRLKLIAAMLLLAIALRLTLEDGGEAELPGGLKRETRSRLGVIATIVAADAVMSLDNVVAVASLANGNMGILIFGLALSIPLLIWGSAFIKVFLEKNAYLILAAGIYLGWLAGSIMVSDPMIAPWVNAEAMALPLTVPLACALFVWSQYRIMMRQKARQGA